MMDQDAFEWLCVMVMIVVFSFLAVWGIIAAADRANERDCQKYGELTGYEVRVLDYNHWCVYNHPDEGWIPAWRGH